MKYLVYRIDEKAQLDVAGIYDNFEDAKARLNYVEDNFTFGKGEWEMEAIPPMNTEFGSVLSLNVILSNKKD